MAGYEIKEFAGGISPFADRGIRGAFKFGSNLDIRKAVDTLSCGQALKEEGLFGISHSVSASMSPSGSQSPSRSGSLSQSPSGTPSQSNSPSASKSASLSQSPSGSQSPSNSASASPSASTGDGNIFEDLIRFFVKCSDGNTYGFGSTGCIYRRYSGGYWRMVFKDPNGAIKGAIEKPSSSATYLYWATDTKLFRKPIPGNSGWTDVQTVSENLTGADWHTMAQIGGAAHIANGSKLAFVGYDDSFNNQALDMIPGNVAKTIVERNGRAVIGTYKAGYPNKGVNGMIDTEVPLIQMGDDGEISFANFTDTMPSMRFPGGGRVNPGGVANEIEQINIFDWEQTALSWIDKQTLGNMSLWGVFDADSGKNGVYTYGRRNKEQLFTLNLEYALEVNEIGAVTTVDGVTLISYRDGSNFGVKAVDPDNKAVGIYEGLEFRAPIKTPVDFTNWKTVEIFTNPLPSGCTIKFYYKVNKNGDWIQAYTADGGTQFATTGANKAVFRLGSQGDIYEPRLVLTPYLNTTPEVYSIKTYFQ
jgi:hypothetical protein